MEGRGRAAGSRSASRRPAAPPAAMDAREAVRRLSLQEERGELLSTLTEVRRRVVHTRSGLDAFVRAGGLREVARLLQQPQPAPVLNLTLSLMANCTARPSGREYVLRNGGLHAVLNLLQVVADPEACTRACRTLANLAQEPQLCRTLFLNDALEAVNSLMTAEETPPTDELRTAVMRLWRHMADSGSHQRALLRAEVAESAARALCSSDHTLQTESLKLLSLLAAGFPRETGTQMQQAAEAFATLLRLCGASAELPAPAADPQLAPSALRLALTLSRQAALRPALGQHGLIRLLRDAAENAAEAGEEPMETDGAPETVAQIGSGGSVASSTCGSTIATVQGIDRCGLISALCLFSWESVNRARLRALHIPVWLLSILSDGSESAPLRRRVLHALYQFLYDEAGLEQLRAAGLTAVLVQRLQALVDGWRPAEPEVEEGDEERYRADSPTYRQVEREMGEYLQQVKRCGEDEERLWKSFSPTGSLASSPHRSPDASPPFWCASGGSVGPGASPVSSTCSSSWQWSPAGGGGFSPPTSPGGSFSPPVSPGGSASPSGAAPPNPFSPQGSGSGDRFSPPVSPSGAQFSPVSSPARAPSPSPLSPGPGREPAIASHISPPMLSLVPLLASPVHRSTSSSSAVDPRPAFGQKRPPPDSSTDSVTNPAPSSPRKRARATSVCSSASSSADPAPSARGGDEPSWLLLLLSRESQRERPDPPLYAPAGCSALLQYLQWAPQPQQRACRLLARLARNPVCFGPMVRQRVAGRCVRALDRSRAGPLLDSLRAVAESGYGQGVLASMVDTGGEGAAAAVATAALAVRLTSNLRRLLLSRHGLDLLLEHLFSEDADASATAGDAIVSLAEHLSPRLAGPAVPAAVPPGEVRCQYRCDRGRQDVTLVVADGEVRARRERLAAGGPVLAALLTGGFREASSDRVQLGDLSKGVAEALVHVVYGCQTSGCLLLRHLPPRRWLPLLAAADRFLLTDAADSLSARVLGCREPAALTELYTSSLQQLPLQLGDGEEQQLQLELLRRLLQTGRWGGGAEQLQLLRRKVERQRLLLDLRQVVTTLLETGAT